MSIDNTTYNFCIESLRYIHKIIGYKAIIEELNFIQHLHTPHRSKCISEQSNNNQGIPENIISAMIELDNMTEYNYDSESDSIQESEIKDTNKNIIIETKQNKNKYVRNKLPDDKRCEFNLPTGNRCTFKKADNSNNCSRHTKQNT